jgi:hypothetical protein
MTKKELIEKIFKVVEPHYSKPDISLIIRLLEDEVHLVLKDKVEVVEGEPQKGDFVKFTLSHIGASGVLGIHYEEITEDYDDLDFGHFEIEGSTIIQRNRKPAIPKEAVL